MATRSTNARGSGFCKKFHYPLKYSVVIPGNRTILTVVYWDAAAARRQHIIDRMLETDQVCAKHLAERLHYSPIEFLVERSLTSNTIFRLSATATARCELPAPVHRTFIRNRVDAGSPG